MCIIVYRFDKNNYIIKKKEKFCSVQHVLQFHLMMPRPCFFVNVVCMNTRINSKSLSSSIHALLSTRFDMRWAVVFARSGLTRACCNDGETRILISANSPAKFTRSDRCFEVMYFYLDNTIQIIFDVGWNCLFLLTPWLLSLDDVMTLGVVMRKRLGLKWPPFLNIFLERPCKKTFSWNKHFRLIVFFFSLLFSYTLLQLLPTWLASKISHATFRKIKFVFSTIYACSSLLISRKPAVCW